MILNSITVINCILKPSTMKTYPSTMKTFINPYFKILVAFLCLSSFNDMYSQVRVDFEPRTAEATPDQSVYSIKGDFTLIGNTNLTLQNYSDSTNNLSLIHI